MKFATPGLHDSYYAVLNNQTLTDHQRSVVIDGLKGSSEVIENLQARVKELEEENSRLGGYIDEHVGSKCKCTLKQRVVDAAREQDEKRPDQTLYALHSAIRELDGENKTEHANSQECEICGGSECTD